MNHMYGVPGCLSKVVSKNDDIEGTPLKKISWGGLTKLGSYIDLYTEKNPPFPYLWVYATVSSNTLHLLFKGLLLHISMF